MSGKDVWQAVEDDHFGKSPFAVQVYQDRNFLRTIRLEPDVTYIGRMPENHIVIDDPQASRSHARILFKDGRLWVEDQESVNGLLVNGKKVQQQDLEVGDRIEIGKYLLEVVEATASAKTIRREDQLEGAEEQEWRQDQTISMSSEQLQKHYQAQLEAMKKQGQGGSKSGKKSDKAKSPQMKVLVKIGDKTFEKTMVFEKGRKREEADSAENFLAVRLAVGPWILEKKVKL